MPIEKWLGIAKELILEPQMKKKKRKNGQSHEEDEVEHSMTEKFAKILVNVATEFKNMMAERPANSGSVSMPLV